MADEGNQPRGNTWGDEISDERKAELRAAYKENVAGHKAPYANVQIKGRTELEWLMFERGWWEVNYDGMVESSSFGDFREAILTNANLSGLHVPGARFQGAKLRKANLTGADLSESDLSGADLSGANLSNARLDIAHLTGARLDGANLSRASVQAAYLKGASLRYARLNDAQLSYVIRPVDDQEFGIDSYHDPTVLSEADLSNAILFGTNLAEANMFGTDLSQARMDSATVLTDVLLDSRVCLADVVWSGTPLLRIQWDRVPTLGDEWKASQHNDANGHPKNVWQHREELEAAARAYHLLAVALRAQGLDERANHYAYRAQVLRTQSLWQQRHYGSWAGSMFIQLTSRLWPIIAVYLIIVVGFAGLYLLFGLSPSHHAAWQRPIDALWVSVTAIHGRVFFESFPEYGRLAWIAALESICGIVVEAVFIAVLLQKLFNR